MTNETDSFVQEVDESLRQDRMLTIIRRYGPLFLLFFVVVVGGLTGWQQWRAYQLNAAREHGEVYAAAQQLAGAGNMDAAKTEFSRLTETGPRIYRVMAGMEYAAILQFEGDLEDAVREFDKAAAAARDPVMRETAQLRAAYIIADTQNFEALRGRLEPLIASNSRLSFLARELLGVEAYEAGQSEFARETLQGLSLALDAPEGVRERAQEALSVIGPAPETNANGAADAPVPPEGESK